MKLLRAADRSAISIADIVSNGPFSRFPGIDRKLAVLKGKVALTVEGVTTVTLDPHTAALDFHGEAAVQADLVGGPSRDLNVMTRRGRFVSRIIQRSAGTLTLSSGATVMVALGRLTAAGHDMEPLDALLVDDAEQSTLTIGPADFCLIEISPWP